jgi:hypothetical protein
LKPTDILDILDLAMEARQRGNIFNPCFVGAPGLAKSALVQQWCRKKKIPFIDLRAAYLEAPDLIGYPTVVRKGDRDVTAHNIPDYWPTEGEGVIFLDEVNRGTTSVMNTFMQLLTDRKVHKYELPEGWIVVAAVNPENEEHDVNTMDAALKNRLEMFQIEFDKKDFVKYMISAEWDKSIINFVDTNTWTYIPPEEISKADGSQYISPRTLEKLNTVVQANVHENKSIEKIVYEAILGRNVGMAFFQFKNNEMPVSYEELENPRTYDFAIAKLKSFADPKNYKSGHISITIKDIVDKGTINDELLAKVVLALPADQGPVLIKELAYKRKDDTILNRICKGYPEVEKYLRKYP